MYEPAALWLIHQSYGVDSKQKVGYNYSCLHLDILINHIQELHFATGNTKACYAFKAVDALALFHSIKEQDVGR